LRAGPLGNDTIAHDEEPVDRRYNHCFYRLNFRIIHEITGGGIVEIAFHAEFVPRIVLQGGKTGMLVFRLIVLPFIYVLQRVSGGPYSYDNFQAVPLGSTHTDGAVAPAFSVNTAVLPFDS
jgi:hypothetical protein